MKTRNRILSIILTLMLCIGMLSMTALAASQVNYTLVLCDGKGYQDDTSGTEVTLSELGITSSGDAVNGYTYTFGGVNFETTASTAISIEDENATIKLADNSVNVVKGGDNLYGNTYGIYAENNLTFSGNGKLDVIAGEAKYNSVGIFVYNNVTVDSGTVTAAGGKSTERSSYGMNAWGDIKVIDGTVTATGGEATDEYGTSYGIYGDSNFAMEGGTVTANGGKATASRGMEIYADFTANGGTVTANGNAAGRTSYGIYTLLGDCFTVTGGTVNGTGGAVTGAHGFKSIGICADAIDGGEGNFTVTGGTVNGTGGKAAQLSVGISAAGDVTVESGDVTAISDAAGYESYGIEVDGDFSVSGGKVKGVSAEAELISLGMYVGSDAEITAGEVILSGKSLASGSYDNELEEFGPFAPNTQVEGVNVMSVYGGEMPDGTDALYLADWVGAGRDDVSNYKYLRFTNTYPVTVINGTGSGEYEKGATVKIKANEPESGMLFDKWVGADGLTFTSGSAATADAEFTMPAGVVTLTATYKAMPVVETPVSPPTGDYSNMVLMYALLFVSGMGIVATTVYGRKRRTN